MWAFEHSVECKADRNFAWEFWTNVSNWPVVDSSVESAVLDGPFRSGTKFITKPRGGEVINGELEDVRDGRGAVVVIHAPGAALRCVWKFEDAGKCSTRLTQQATIEGEKARDYLPAAAELEETIPQGMQRLAETIEQFALGSALGRWLCLF
jgi:hypothetical protein